LRLFNLVNQQLHTVNSVEGIEHLAQDPDAVKLIILEQELLFPGPGAIDINSREDPLVDQPTIEMDFHITGAFELFKDDLVHATPGIHQRGRDNGETAAFLNVTGRPKKAFGFLQRVGVNTPLQHFPTRRHDGVIRTRQTGNAIQEDNHIPLMLDQTFGLLDDHFGHLHVA
jgi:hypothetical protein